jgi:hypothetical protein
VLHDDVYDVFDYVVSSVQNARREVCPTLPVRCCLLATCVELRAEEVHLAKDWVLKTS